jgi:hypothetical protein
MYKGQTTSTTFRITLCPSLTIVVQSNTTNSHRVVKKTIIINNKSI